MAKGIWLVTCDLSTRDYSIQATGSEDLPNNRGSRYYSVMFGDDQYSRATLTLYPDTPEEANVILKVSQISKKTFHAVLISGKCLSKKWDEYCKNRKIK
jgi:hypothetical protein